MTDKDKALRIAVEAFRLLRLGTKLDDRQLKALECTCALALPVAYRFRPGELPSLPSVIVRRKDDDA